MLHFASASFWNAYDRLPAQIRDQADASFALLKQNPQHPSLHFKRVGKYWSIRVGLHYRALATEVNGEMHWHWIGSHSAYNGIDR